VDWSYIRRKVDLYSQLKDMKRLLSLSSSKSKERVLHYRSNTSRENQKYEEREKVKVSINSESTKKWIVEEICDANQQLQISLKLNNHA
jgi:hypothetical protein